MTIMKGPYYYEIREYIRGTGLYYCRKCGREFNGSHRVPIPGCCINPNIVWDEEKGYPVELQPHVQGEG